MGTTSMITSTTSMITSTTSMITSTTSTFFIPKISFSCKKYIYHTKILFSIKNTLFISPSAKAEARHVNPEDKKKKTKKKKKKKKKKCVPTFKRRFGKNTIFLQSSSVIRIDSPVFIIRSSVFRTQPSAYTLFISPSAKAEARHVNPEDKKKILV